MPSHSLEDGADGLAGSPVTLREVRLDNDVWHILFGHEARPALNGPGDPAGLLPGWACTSALEFNGGFFFFLLHHDGGPKAIWVLDSVLGFVSDLANFTEASSPALFVLLTAAARRFVEDVRRHPLAWPDDSGWAALRAMGDPALAPLTALSGLSAQVLSAGKSAVFDFDGLTSRVNVPSAALQRALDIARPDHDQQPYVWLSPAAAAGRVVIHAISQPGFVDSAYLIGRWVLLPTYFCREQSGNLSYYLIQVGGRASVLYFPNNNVLVAREELSEIDAYEIVAGLDRNLFALIPFTSGAPPSVAKAAGLFTAGLRHFGHVIWEEYHAIDKFVSESVNNRQQPYLYVVPAVTGTELYGCVEDLYPELRGYVVRASSEPELFAHAIRAGVELVPRSGLGCLQASRRRIASVTRRHAELHKLPRRLARLNSPGRSALIITLGLRLMNRCPVDLLGFYTRLSISLSNIFGPIVIVLDGLNGGDDETKAAAQVFNGLRKSEVGFIESLRDGSAELEQERAWADRFLSGLQNSPVTVISCIGRPIHENLYWMSKSSFFVAPFGAGLAKLRWALDIPGLVLTSCANLEYCTLLTVYNDDINVEPPYTSLYFTRAEDVHDLALEPPRASPPQLQSIPHPEDFIVNEDVVIPQICDLVARHDSRHRTRSLVERIRSLGDWVSAPPRA